MRGKCNIVISTWCTRSSVDWIHFDKQKKLTAAVITTGCKAEVKVSPIRGAEDRTLKKHNIFFPSRCFSSLTIPLSAYSGSHSGRAGNDLLLLSTDERHRGSERLCSLGTSGALF